MVSTFAGQSMPCLWLQSACFHMHTPFLHERALLTACTCQSPTAVIGYCTWALAVLLSIMAMPFASLHTNYTQVESRWIMLDHSCMLMFILCMAILGAFSNKGSSEAKAPVYS